MPLEAENAAKKKAKRAEESVVGEKAERAKRLGRAEKANAEEVKRANAEDAANKLFRPKLG